MKSEVDQLDISSAMGSLGRYQSDSDMDQWKVAEKALRHARLEKFVVTCRRSDHLEMVEYISDFTIHFHEDRQCCGEM